MFGADPAVAAYVVHATSEMDKTCCTRKLDLLHTAFDGDSTTQNLNLGPKEGRKFRERDNFADGLQCVDPPESARPNTPFPFKPQNLLDSIEKKERLNLIHANTLKIRTRVAKKRQTDKVTSGSSAVAADDDDDSKEMFSGEMVGINVENHRGDLCENCEQSIFSSQYYICSECKLVFIHKTCFMTLNSYEEEELDKETPPYVCVTCLQDLSYLKYNAFVLYCHTFIFSYMVYFVLYYTIVQNNTINDITHHNIELYIKTQIVRTFYDSLNPIYKPLYSGNI